MGFVGMYENNVRRLAVIFLQSFLCSHRFHQAPKLISSIISKSNEGPSIVLSAYHLVSSVCRVRGSSSGSGARGVIGR